MIKIIKRTLVLILILLTFGVSYCYADSTSDNYNNYVYPMSTYKKPEIQPFSLINSGQSENITTATGELEITQTDLSLKGKNGLDFNLTRIYRSSDAKLYEPNYIPNSTYYSFLVQGYYISGTETKEIYTNGTLTSTTYRNVSLCPTTAGYEEVASDYLVYRGQQYWSTSQNAQKAADDFMNGVYDNSKTYTSGNNTILEVTKYSDKHDFSVKIRYLLTESGSAIPYYEGYWDSYNTLTTTDKYFNLGTGWSFDLPYIEVKSDGNIYLNLGSKGAIHFTWSFATYDLAEAYTPPGYDVPCLVTFENYPYDDLKLYHTIYKQTLPYSTSEGAEYFRLEDKNGQKMFFARDGRLLGIVDRFGNEMKFFHSTSITGYPITTKVIDSVGREINFDYQTNRITVSVNDVTNASNNRTIYYNKTASPGVSSEYRLSSVTNAENMTTSYEYEQKSANFAFRKKDPYTDFQTPTGQNSYELLNKITYPTGGTTNYSYNDGKYSHTNLGSSGFERFYKVTSRAEYTKAGNQYNYKEYVYKNYFNGDGAYEYDGYPSYFQTSVPTGFNVITDVYDLQGNKDTYTYNWIKNVSTSKVDLLPTNVLSVGTDHKNETINTFDLNSKMLIKTTNRIFNKATGNYQETNENFQYNTFKEIVAYWDAQAEGNTADVEHKTTYTYNGTYHYITSKTYKKDQNTAIVEEYIPYSGDERKIEYYKIKENGNLKRQTRYVYDTYGNVTEEQQYNDDWSTYIATKYDYTDNDSARSGKFNGLYLTRKWIENVKNIDQVLDNSAGITVDENYKYDWFGNLVEKKDGQGYSTTYKFDKLGRVVEEKHADNSYKSWLYTSNSTENTARITDENSNSIKYIFDDFGNLEKEQDVSTGQFLNQYTYDDMMRLKTESNQNTSASYRIITYNYYTDNRIADKETKDQNSSIIEKKSYVYDNANSNGSYIKISETSLGDANSPSITNISYINKYGQLEKLGSIHNGQELLSTLKYDYLGNKIEEKSARAYDENWSEAWTSKYEYNYAGQLTKTYDIKNNIIAQTYDALGRLVSSTDARGNLANPKYSSSFVYDVMGQLIEEKIPVISINGTMNYAIKRHYYDKNGSLVLQKTSSNKPGEALTFDQTGYEYNNRNMLVKVTTYNGTTPENYSQYYYDSVGNKRRQYTGLSAPLTINGLDQVTAGSDSIYSVTSYEYDRFGRLGNMKDASGKDEVYTLDLNGNLVTKIDRNGNIITNTYDGLNRLKSSSVTTPDGSGNISYTYDYTLIGTRKLMDNTTYLYDDLGRVDTETEGSIVKKYTYDAANNRKSFVIKNNGMIVMNTTYDYDKMNRLEKVFENNALIATYSYDENGNRQALTYSNGNNMSYDFNFANQLTALSNKKSTSVLSQYSYEYYLSGNQAKKSDNTGKVTSFTYDGLGRLKIEADNTGNSNSYSYDDNNNRKTMTASGNNDLNIGTNSNTYTYDGFNQLKGTNSDDQNISYTYDGDGLRTSKTVNGQLTYQVWDGDQIALELDGSGNVTKKYIRGINLIYSEDGTGTNRRYFMYNAHGDVIQLTDSSGNVVKSYEYDAFGNEKNPDQNDSNVFRYCGEYFDKETGNIYLRARYYDPTIGRFISEDPIGAGLNWYTYCDNNPNRFIDPLGLESIVVSGGDYSDESVHAGFSYNFIEPAIQKIREIRKADADETIAWLIGDAGWSDDDWANFSEVVSKFNVSIVRLSSADDLVNYINNKTGGDSRANDKITSFTVFSHGFEGKISLGYNYDNDGYNKSLDFSTGDIDSIHSYAFDNPTSWFYSCKTGTGGNNSFAQAWANQVGGTTWAYKGKTTYQYIMYPREYFTFGAKVNRALGGKWADYADAVELLRMRFGFSFAGSMRYPEAADGATLLKFTR